MKLTRLFAVVFFLVFFLTPPTFAEDKQRLISTDAGVTQLLFALGADQHLVAVDVTSKLPKQYRPLNNIGYHRTLSAEGLLSLEPSTVIGSEDIGPVEVVTALQAARVELLQLPSAKSTDQLLNNIKSVSKTVKAQEQGAILTREVKHKLQTLENKGPLPLATVFVLSMDPSKLRMAGKDTAADAFIGLLGARNVADFNNYRTVSAESLMAMKPQLIILVGKSSDNVIDSFLQANPIVQHSDAAKNQRIVAVDGGSLVAGLSVQAVDEALRLSHRFHAK